MNDKIQRYLLLLIEGLKEALRRHPVELSLILVGSVCMVIAEEVDWGRECLLKIWMLPLFALVALVVGTLAGRTVWRRLYWVSWLPMVPLLCWPGLSDWMRSVPFAITAGILLPLAVLLSRRAADNRRFVSDAVIYLRSALLAALFANVALGLFEAILWSTAYIFGFAEYRWVGRVATDVFILAEMLALPALFLMMLDRWSGGTCRGSRILEVLVNYIVTPALMVYAAILYLYMAKIAVQWSLPEGGVAYMVFAFALLALAMRALQSLLDKRIGEWFYRSFSYVLLPAAVLFWAGVARRVGEYGLTAPRVLLVLCGGLMTLTMLLFLTRRTGRYLYLCIAAFVCFGAVAYVPGMLPEQIAARSQYRRAVEAAEKLDLLGGNGLLLLDRFAPDSLTRAEYRRLYEAVDYVSRRDEAAFGRFGVSMEEFREAIPASCYDYVVYGNDRYGCEASCDLFYITADPGRTVHDFSRYRTLYPMLRSWHSSDGANYRFTDDSLFVHFGGTHPPLVIASADLLRSQFRKAGIGTAVTDRETLQQASDELLLFRDEEVLIVFSDMSFEVRDSALVLQDVSVELVMTR